MLGDWPGVTLSPALSPSAESVFLGLRPPPPPPLIPTAGGRVAACRSHGASFCERAEEMAGLPLS